MSDNTQWVEQSHTNQTDTPKNGGRYIALDNVAGYLYWAVQTDPRISELLQSSKQAGRMLQRVVLASLAVHANDQGIARVSQERIAQDIAVDRRDVRNALTQLHQVGLINPAGKAVKGKTQGYLVLPFVVVEKQRQLEETTEHGGQHGGEVGGQHGGRPGGLSRHKVEVEIEPPLQQKRQAKDSTATDPGGIEGIIKLCIERDLKQHPTQVGTGLRKKMHTQYSELVTTARERYPNAVTDTAIVTWCVNQRWRLEHTKELLKDLDPDRYSCATCKGATVVPGQSYRDDQDNWVNPGNVPCPTCRTQNVTQLDTHKRVNTETRTNTYLVGGAAQADPLSVSDIAKRMTAN
jgi:hypothetical protein